MNSEKTAWRRAIDMLNEMHEAMNWELIDRTRMDRMKIDKIAEKHMEKALNGE